MQHNVTFFDLLSLIYDMYVGCMLQYDGNIMNDTGVRCSRKAAPSMHDDSEIIPLTMYLFKCFCLHSIDLVLFFLHISNSLLQNKVHAFWGPCSLNASTGKQQTVTFSIPSSSWGAIVTIIVTKHFYEFMSVLMYEILTSCCIKNMYKT